MRSSSRWIEKAPCISWIFNGRVAVARISKPNLARRHRFADEFFFCNRSKIRAYLENLSTSKLPFYIIVLTPGLFH